MKLLRVALVLFALARIAVALPADSSVPELLNAGRIDQAIRALQGILSSDPQNALANFQLCRAYFFTDDFDNAVRYCERAVQSDPNTPAYHLWLGRAYGEKADRAGLGGMSLAKKAVAQFERAVQLAPDNVQARADLAEFYREAPGFLGGGSDKARQVAAETEKIDPAAAANMRAQAALKNKDYPTAEREAQLAVKESSEAAQYWLELARVYSKQKHWTEFENAIVKAMSANRRTPEDEFNAGEMLVSQGRNLNGAIQILQNYVKGKTSADAPVFRAYYLIGKAYEKLGDKSAAAQQYREALSMAKDFRPAQNALSKLRS